MVVGVPPVATVYQVNIFPEVGVAFRGIAMAFWQYETGVITVGAEGV